MIFTQLTYWLDTDNIFSQSLNTPRVSIDCWEKNSKLKVVIDVLLLSSQAEYFDQCELYDHQAVNKESDRVKMSSQARIGKGSTTHPKQQSNKECLIFDICTLSFSFLGIIWKLFSQKCLRQLTSSFSLTHQSPLLTVLNVPPLMVVIHPVRIPSTTTRQPAFSTLPAGPEGRREMG